MDAFEPCPALGECVWHTSPTIKSHKKQKCQVMHGCLALPYQCLVTHDQDDSWIPRPNQA